MTNSSLTKAKTEKNDEFYTRYEDIEIELLAYYDYNPDVFRGKTILLPCDDPEQRSEFINFFVLNYNRLGVKKLIATSYTKDGRGKILTMRGTCGEIKWHYLEGDGDFRSEEVTNLRDEADIIITNPPFSLFREFLSWITETGMQFIIIGNMNAITYKEVFPLIKENEVWLGTTNGAKTYIKPDNTLQTFGNTCWFTNIEHGKRHKPLQLMTMAENLKHSKHKNLVAYEQFEILGSDSDIKEGLLPELVNPNWKGKMDRGYVNNRRGYSRILIKHRK